MTTNREEYNGWTNRETWACNLWLSNDEGFVESVNELADEARREAAESGRSVDGYLADAIESYVDELKEFADESKTGSEIRSMFDDIGSLWRVDWREIATAWLAD